MFCCLRNCVMLPTFDLFLKHTAPKHAQTYPDRNEFVKQNARKNPWNYMISIFLKKKPISPILNSL